MRYLYTDRKLVCIENISLVEIFQNEIVLTLNSGRKLSVFSTNNDSDLNEVFHELSKEIRRGDSDIDMWELQNHMKFYNGVDEGTWYSWGEKMCGFEIGDIVKCINVDYNGDNMRFGDLYKIRDILLKDNVFYLYLD